MKKILILTLMLLSVAALFSLSVSAKELDDGAYFTLVYDAGDKKAGEDLPLTKDGEGLIWYINGENILVSVKASEVSLVFEAQDQEKTQIGNLPLESGAPCLKAIKVQDTVIQSIDGTKSIVCANMQSLSFKYIYTNGNTTLFANNNTLQCLYLPSTLKRIPKYSFYACEALAEFDMGESVLLVWERAFSGLKSLKKIKLSNTCLFLGAYAFSGSSCLEEIRLGESMQYIADKILDRTSQERIDFYMPDTVTTFAAPYNNYLTIFYTGSFEQAKSKLPTFGVVTYTFLPYGEFDGACTTEGLKWIAYYDTSLCDAFYDNNHIPAKDDGNCTTAVICQRCEKDVLKAKENHTLSAQISYEKGYLNNGTRTEACLNCDYKEYDVAYAFFTTGGYSTPEDGRGELVIRFEINKKAIDEYKSIYGELKYGVFAASYDKILADGNLNGNNSLTIEINENYTAFEFRISNFETEEQKAAKLSIGVYVQDYFGKISYLQYGTQGGLYSYITFNDILK